MFNKCLDIYFDDLTTPQKKTLDGLCDKYRRKNSTGILITMACWGLVLLPWSELLKVTKNKKILNKISLLRQQNLRIAA